MRDRTVNIHVQRVDNGYVVAADFDRYNDKRKITTVETSREEIDKRMADILDDLENEENDE